MGVALLDFKRLLFARPGVGGLTEPNKHQSPSLNCNRMIPTFAQLNGLGQGQGSVRVSGVRCTLESRLPVVPRRVLHRRTRGSGPDSSYGPCVALVVRHDACASLATALCSEGPSS